MGELIDRINRADRYYTAYRNGNLTAFDLIDVLMEEGWNDVAVNTHGDLAARGSLNGVVYNLTRVPGHAEG